MAYLLYTIRSKMDNNMKRCKFHPSWILDSVQDTSVVSALGAPPEVLVSLSLLLRLEDTWLKRGGREEAEVGAVWEPSRFQLTGPRLPGSESSGRTSTGRRLAANGPIGCQSNQALPSAHTWRTSVARGRFQKHKKKKANDNNKQTGAICQMASHFEQCSNAGGDDLNLLGLSLIFWNVKKRKKKNRKEPNL